MKNRKITFGELSAILDVSKATVNSWANKGTFPVHKDNNGTPFFYEKDLLGIPEVAQMANTKWDEEYKVKPNRDYTSVELFAGAGGLALGMSLAGFKHVLLNEFDHNACETLRKNKPKWNVVEGDIHDIDFTSFRDKVDLLTGGFPCQAFSYAGKGGGFNDARGTLFFELARAAKEINPKVIMCENVKGLTTHDNGNTFRVIKNTICELGYTLYEPQVLKACCYKVPQKRERIILVAVRNDLLKDKDVRFVYPEPFHRVLTLRDAFYKGILYKQDVPLSIGQKYPQKKQAVMALVPEGGDWRDLPDDVARSYMGGSYHLGGGKTGMARRLSLDEPSLTLTCAPAQKQTERCHPIETRPLTVREYARIQTFPDKWEFAGDLTSQYKQIGNAVPVNMAAAVGRSLVRLLNELEK